MRTIAIITSPNNADFIQQGYFYIPENHQLKAIPFSNAKTILGQEYPFAIYTMQAENGVNFNFRCFCNTCRHYSRKRYFIFALSSVG